MAAGEVWWFDNTVEHEVVNNSADDRIVLICDIRST
jgi:aspartyl/asparaginyl beta-hydroxylase (cupin superfamily)